MPKIREGENLVMVEEKSGNGTKYRKATAKDVKEAPTKDQPRLAKKIREQGYRESSIKKSKRLD